MWIPVISLFLSAKLGPAAVPLYLLFLQLGTVFPNTFPWLFISGLNPDDPLVEAFPTAVDVK